jgi:transposase
MAKRLVSDELWAAVEPLLPPVRAAGTRGHPPVPNRVALAGVIFVLKTGIPWEYFPQELGCSGMTLWRRLRDWQRAGVWERLHRELLQRLADAGRIDWSRASADASRVPAKKGGGNCRVLVRYERDADLHDAFLHLGAALVCWLPLAPTDD